MFFHTKRFQYNAKPDNPDPIFAKQMQELLGGQWGEISVMMTYLFQGVELPRSRQVPRHAHGYRHRGDWARGDDRHHNRPPAGDISRRS